MPLTAAQRELISIFVHYLQRLPVACCNPDTWQDAKELIPVRRFVLEYFKELYPDWKPDPKDGNYLLNDLPEFASDRYEWLITNACNPEDPAKARLKRQRELREARSLTANLQRSHQNMLDGIAKRFSVSREFLTAPDETPIERSTAAAYRRNHSDTDTPLEAG